jgi:tetratricopeptide (TPR) repeat protein
LGYAQPAHATFKLGEGKVLKIDPGDAKAENNIGIALMREGRLDEAIAHFEKALELNNPDADEVHDNIGNALMQEGRLDEAIAHFEKALEFNPDSDQAHDDIGIALTQKGRPDEAITHFEKALEFNPGSDRAHDNIGIALLQEGKPDEAVTHFEKALELNPRNTHARFNLGYVFYSRGEIPEALAQWLQGLRVAPDVLPVLNQTAWVLATCPDASVRNGAEAVELAERASHLSGAQDPAILDTLAAAYAEAGQFPKAVEIAQQALALAMQQSNQPLAEALKGRIALYESKIPFREKPSPPTSLPARR